MPFVNENLFFFHITKTGGTSINEALSIKTTTKNLARYCNKKNADLQHLSPPQMEIMLNDKTLARIDKMKKFCFMRNPYDRFSSEYHWRVKRGYLLGDECIEVFLDNLLNKVAYPYVEHFNFQSDYLTFRGQPLDFIGRFENINKDFYKVTELFGIKKCVLKKRNTSKHKKPLTKSIKEGIFKLWEKDFELLEYEK